MTIGYETREDAVAFARKASADQTWRNVFLSFETDSETTRRWLVRRHADPNRELPLEDRFVSPEGEVFELVPDLPLAHIEDLWNAAEKYRQAQVRAMRDPASFERNIAKARVEFAEWCQARELPIDFTLR